VVERRLPAEQRRDGEQRVEPAPGLILGLADEVRREAFGETILVLEREVMLGEGHRTGVEPHVDHLGHAIHRLLAPGFGTGNRDLVHKRAVMIGERLSGQLLQFGERSDHVHVSPRAAPHG
jgi:hypothetical protein